MRYDCRLQNIHSSYIAHIYLLTFQLTGTVLNHSAPSLSTASIDFGDVLVGTVVASENGNLQNAIGPFRADLVLTTVNGSGHTSTLTRGGSSTGSIAAGSSLANSIGLVMSAAGAYSATYGYDVEDQNVAGGVDQTTQNIAVSATVIAAALLTDNSATTLGDGSAVLVSNAAAAPLRSVAYVNSYSISPSWTLNNLAVGSVMVPGSNTSTASVSVDDTGLLNGQSIGGTLSIQFENNQAIMGAADQDLGSLAWNLSHTVSGNVGDGSADVGNGGSYAGLNGHSDETLGTQAHLLGGTNSTGLPTTVTMTWRDRTADEANGFAASLPLGSVGLATDVLNLSGTEGSAFVLELTVDPQSSLDSLFLAWFDGADWVLATLGNLGVNTTNPLWLNYQGSWEDSGAGLALGAYGYGNGVVWAVLDHTSEFSAVEVEANVEAVPEPSTMVLAVVGLLTLGLVACRRRGRA